MHEHLDYLQRMRGVALITWMPELGIPRLPARLCAVYVRTRVRAADRRMECVYIYTGVRRGEQSLWSNRPVRTVYFVLS